MFVISLRQWLYIGYNCVFLWMVYLCWIRGQHSQQKADIFIWQEFPKIRLQCNMAFSFQVLLISWKFHLLEAAFQHAQNVPSWGPTFSWSDLPQNVGSRLVLWSAIKADPVEPTLPAMFGSMARVLGCLLVAHLALAAPLSFTFMGSTWTMEVEGDDLHVTAECPETWRNETHCWLFEKRHR